MMADEPPTHDLDFVTTEEIMAELEKRFPDGLVVITEQVMTTGETVTNFSYKGGVSVCLGMTVRMCGRLKRETRRFDG